MPYDMDSPLSQLASGWRDSPRYLPRKLPTPPIPDPQEALSQSEMAYDVASTHSKVLSERSQQARPKHRTISPESRRSDLLYIIPKGLNVIFQDEDGNEITRVGEFNGRQRRISTTIIQDEDGRELHRTSDIENPNAHRGAEPGRHSSRDEEFEYNRSGRRNPRSRSAEVHRSEW
ncbi:hypothetical protein B0H13DRAFT_199059 [Mycena leptocephala]|nr:hypothetical protein B0H13DRAFT_199059 [Mycena leptocephala]